MEFGRPTVRGLERILNCCGLFEGKSPHPNPLPKGEGTLVHPNPRLKRPPRGRGDVGWESRESFFRVIFKCRKKSQSVHVYSERTHLPFFSLFSHFPP